MNKSLTLLVFLLVINICSAADSAMQIHTIPLKHQSPAGLINSLKPLMDEGAYLTHHGQNIIVRTSAKNLSEIQLLIDELDRPLTQLLISVRRGNQFDNQNTRISLSGKHTNSNGGVIFDNTQQENQKSDNGSYQTHTRITTSRTTLTGQGNNNYQVRGLEGHPSYINTGSEVPTTHNYTDLYGRTHSKQEYKAVHRGFYATPHLYGERVSVDISSRHDRVDNANRESRNKNPGTAINREEITTHVSGRLGEWIAIGGFDQSDKEKSTGLTRYRSTKSLSARTIYLKIERID